MKTLKQYALEKASIIVGRFTYIYEDLSNYIKEKTGFDIDKHFAEKHDLDEQIKKDDPLLYWSVKYIKMLMRFN